MNSYHHHTFYSNYCYYNDTHTQPFNGFASVGSTMSHPASLPIHALSTLYGDEGIILDSTDMYHPQPRYFSSQQQETTHARYPYIQYDGVVLDSTDMYYASPPPLSSSTRDDEVEILQTLNNDQINQIAEYRSGLTNDLIFNNLHLQNYREKEVGEVCVVCQAEFKHNKKIAVLQCKHRYHPGCIKEWLLRKNTCPLCKCQALPV